jgi:uncharacterized membrane protein
MIYKIFSLLLLSCFFSTSNLFFSEVKTENKAENKTEVAKTKKTRLKVMLRFYNNLNSNQFALPKLESFTKALKGFIY